MRKLAGGWRFVVVMILLAGVAGTAQAMNWQTVAADTYKLLWKEITYTELQVDGEQAMPAEGDILTPSYAKQIIIRYGLSVSAERFRKLTDDSLADGYSEEELAPHRRAIDTFNSWYLGVEKGDKYRLSWQPDVGLSLHHNEAHLGTLADAQAAQVILSVWLGRAAVSEDQRDSFLRQWRSATNRLAEN